MEEKKLVNIIFYDNEHKKSYEHIKNKKFVTCCDLLLLKEYDEFEKLLEKEYFYMDNGIIIIDTINLNNVGHFKYILKYIEIYNIKNILLYCLKKGLFKIANYILINNPKFDNYKQYVELSIYSGSLKFYDMYKLKYKIVPDWRFIQAFIEISNFDNVKIFIKKYKHIIPPFVYTHIICCAVKNGNLENIKYIVQKYKPIDNCYVLYDAVKTGIIKNIEYLLFVGYKFNKGNSEFNAAIISNNYKILNWLFKKGCKFGQDTFEVAAEYGNIKIMEWLLEKGCKFNTMTFNMAIKYGDLDNIKWLITNGCEITKDAADYCGPNYLKIMTWLSDKNIKTFNPTIMLNYVAQNLNSNELVFMVDKCYPHTKNVSFTELIQKDNLYAIKILRGYRNNIKDLKAPVFKYYVETFMVAVNHGNMEILKWMLLDKLEYKYYINYNHSVNIVLKKQIKNILKDFVKENNIKIYE